MEQVTLEAQLRAKPGKGDSHRLRVKGEIPAVFYGKGQKNLHLAVKKRDLERVVASKMGMNTIIQLKVNGHGEFNVLLKDYQADSIKRFFTHADFVAVDLAKKVEVDVPIHLTGRPVGLKEGGILEQVTRELKILCLPTNIPSQIEVDVSSLAIGQNLHLEDIRLPEGVEPVEKTNVTIAAVMMIKEEEIVTTPGTMAEPEVLTAKKEEGAEGEAAPAEKGKEAAPAKGEAKAPAKAEAKAPEKKGSEKK